jgi:hypothetical protein
MIAFRHADPSLPFVWEDASQPPARWHAGGEGPATYFSDTPDGAWAEFLRHEEITDPEDVATIRRAMWAVEIPGGLHDETMGRPKLPTAILTGGRDSYDTCQREARRLRDAGARSLVVRTAALLPGAACGERVNGRLQAGPARDGWTIVIFGPQPSLVGWRAAFEGRPAPGLLTRVRRLGD